MPEAGMVGGLGGGGAKMSAWFKGPSGASVGV